MIVKVPDPRSASRLGIPGQDLTPSSIPLPLSPPQVDVLLAFALGKETDTPQILRVAASADFLLARP